VPLTALLRARSTPRKNLSHTRFLDHALVRTGARISTQDCHRRITSSTRGRRSSVTRTPQAPSDDGSWDPAWPTELSVKDTCFENNDPDYPIDTDDNNGDGVFFDEPDELTDGLGNTEDQDPMIVDRAGHDYSDGVDWTAGWTDYSVN